MGLILIFAGGAVILFCAFMLVMELLVRFGGKAGEELADKICTILGGWEDDD